MTQECAAAVGNVLLLARRRNRGEQLRGREVLPRVSDRVRLVFPDLRHRFYAVSKVVTGAVRRAIAGAPWSVAALARAAGVPQSTLARIKAGERAATPAVARAVASALEDWGARCARGLADIRQAQLRKGK